MVKKYNCMGCHQFIPGQKTHSDGHEAIPGHQEQLPPKLLTEGARVDPEWLRRFLSNPSLSETDTNRNGVRPYLKVRMPTFCFSDNELRKLVRFFQALSQQPLPYIPEQVPTLTAKETDMARSLFSSTAAPCLKCHATGDPAHDKIATAPNFLLAKERLKPDWVERWILDPQAISSGHFDALRAVPAREQSLGLCRVRLRRRFRAMTKTNHICWWITSSSSHRKSKNA